jgi:hypothetical protein
VHGRGAVHEDLNSHQIAARPRKRETEAPPQPPTEEEKQAAAKKEYDALLNSKSGGRYVPPAKLRALQQALTDKSSKEYQRMAWEALKKSINGLVNKISVANVKMIVPELFAENLIRGRYAIAFRFVHATKISGQNLMFDVEAFSADRFRNPLLLPFLSPQSTLPWQQSSIQNCLRLVSYWSRGWLSNSKRPTNETTRPCA